MTTLPKLFALSLLAGVTACSITSIVYKELPDEISGSVTGLQGTGLVLTNNGGDDLAVPRDGMFVFASPMARGSDYAVAVKTQPSNPTQICAISHGSGTAGDRDVTDVQVSCSVTAFSVGGTLTGLTGTGAVLQNSAGDDLQVNTDGTFTFATPVASGSSYAVTVRTQPSQPAQVCTVANGSGTVGDSNVTSVMVTCATSSFTVGGTVTGLAGTGLVLRNSGGDDLSISANGSFAFTAAVASGARFAVTVAGQPSQPTQRCTVSGGAGVVVASDVTDVEVTCATSSFTIGGTVTGLVGTGLVIQDNDGDDLAISGDGGFAFAAPVASGAIFAVTVRSQPSQPTQTCTVLGDTGTVGDGDVTSVAINCATNRYMISGTINGLVGRVTLQDNGGDDLDVTSNGAFAFPASLPSGAAYHVTVKAQPAIPSQSCTVANATGTVVGANITNIVVTCATNVFTIGGTVSGLATGDSITLRDNGGDPLIRSANGSFTFAAPVASGQSYAVTVVNPSSPISQTCAIANGSGTVGSANVTTVVVTCTTKAFTIGGTLSGLAPGDSITLRNNGGDALVRSANGGFTFAAPVVSGQSYAVTVVNPSSPISQTCAIANGSGTVGPANITDVAITCTTDPFTISGAISGLAPGNSITLRDNGGDDLGQSTNGGFSFPTQLASGQSYNVTATSPSAPISQTCTVSNGSGVVGNTNVTNVVVACTTNTFTISGTLSGLAPGNSITLRNNGGDDLGQSTNGGFTFLTPVASGQSYTVTVASPTAPVEQTCTVSNGSGTIGDTDITNVAITCGVPPSSGSFSYSATNTNSAQQDTIDVDIPIAAGQRLTIGTCGVPGSSGEGDTFLRLFDQSNLEVAANDDACGDTGLLTLFTFTAPTTQIYRVHAGCFAERSCSGTVAYTLSGT